MNNRESKQINLDPANKNNIIELTSPQTEREKRYLKKQQLTKESAVEEAIARRNKKELANIETNTNEKNTQKKKE
jgi:hypothetical protein